jgi:hypothetical protein
MNREKVKLIVRNMELLIGSLKKELEEPPDHNYEEIVSYIEDDVDEYYIEGEEDV